MPALENNPAQKAKLLFDAGNLDYLLSHRAAEESELRESLRVFESTPALMAEAGQHALYLSKLAEALADVGKRQDSEQYADRAVRVMETISSPPPVEAGINHASLALTYLKIGRVERAREEASRSVELLRLASKPLRELSDMGMWLATIEQTLGNLPAARAAAERSVADAVRAVGSDHPLTVAPRIEFAYARALNGEAEQAIPDLSRCLAQARAGASQAETRLEAVSGKHLQK